MSNFNREPPGVIGGHICPLNSDARGPPQATPWKLRLTGPTNHSPGRVLLLGQGPVSSFWVPL